MSDTDGDDLDFDLALTRRGVLRTPIPPGEVVGAELVTLGLDADALADRLGMAPARLRALLLAERPLDADDAARLAAFFGTSARFWLELEALYRRDRARAGEVVLDADEARRLAELSPEAWARVDAMTDADIARQIADNADVAADFTDPATLRQRIGDLLRQIEAGQRDPASPPG